MKKYLTKSLFVDYMTFEKLARWKVNDPEKYKFIKKIESEEDQEKIMKLGQTVENVVAKHLERKYGATKVDLFPNIPKAKKTEDGEEDDDTDIWVYEQDHRNYFERINDACSETLKAIKNKEPLLYQPSFLIDGCFVRADFMVLNSSGKYDLLEVKAKTTIRSSIKNNGENEPIGEIKKNLIHDVSFQKYVINKVFQNEGIEKLGDVYLLFLNRDYVRKGDLDVMRLVKTELTDISKNITVLQGKKDNPKEKEKIIDDTLLPEKEIEGTIKKISQEMDMDRSEFEKHYPFPGNKYVEYFGEDRPFGTIMGRGVHHSSKDIISELYYQGKTQIKDLSSDQIEAFNSKFSKDGPGTSRIFIDNYLETLAGNNPIIDEPKVREFFDKFSYPICFYDYETVSVPIPFMDDTYAYQQVVVQYSLHKVYPDGTLKHFGGLLQGLGEKKVEQITIENNKNAVEFESEKVVTGSYKDLLEEFIADIGDDYKTASFIIWNKGFENARNREIGKIYSDLEDSFLAINEKTYDLMDVAKKNRYFDIGFEGSASIKKVLPVLVPEMSYKGMGVENGAIAMEKLHKLVSGEMKDETTRKQKINDLLLYCGQDSLAMVRIWEEMRKIF